MKFERIAVHLIPCAMVVLSLGCGSQGPEIKGTVKLDGKPLDSVRVTFLPVGTGADLGGAVADTDAAGTFKVLPQADGVTLKPGKYGVTFTRMVDAQGNVPPERDRMMMQMGGKLTESIPAKYATRAAPRADSPPAEVVEIKDGPADLTFDLKSK